jgi:hypothetical protein
MDFDERRAKAGEYADERARDLVRNESRTKARAMFLFFATVFFLAVTIWRVVRNPDEIGSYSGFIFVFLCVIAIVSLRQRLLRGYELLLQEGELVMPDDESPKPDANGGEDSAASQ